MSDNYQNSPFLHRVAAASIVIAVVAGISLAMRQLAEVGLLVFGSVLIAVFLRALGDWTARKSGLREGWALLIVVLLIIAACGSGLYLGGQSLANQMAELSDRVPRSLDQLREQAAQYDWGRWLANRVPTSARELDVSNQELASYASGALTSVTGLIAGAIVVVFLALYLAYRPGLYLTGLLRLVPLSKRPRVADVLAEVRRTLEGWLFGMIVAMLLVGVLTASGLSLLGVEPAIALGAVAAIFTFVPNLGPVIAAIPAVLISVVESPMTAAYVVALYLGVQTVESYLITPMIQKQAAEVPPALVILAQVAMGVLFGIPGIVLATPILAATLVIVQRLYVEDVLGDTA